MRLKSLKWLIAPLIFQYGFTYSFMKRKFKLSLADKTLMASPALKEDKFRTGKDGEKEGGKEGRGERKESVERGCWRKKLKIVCYVAKIIKIRIRAWKAR